MLKLPSFDPFFNDWPIMPSGPPKIIFYADMPLIRNSSSSPLSMKDLITQAAEDALLHLMKTLSDDYAAKKPQGLLICYNGKEIVAQTPSSFWKLLEHEEMFQIFSRVLNLSPPKDEVANMTRFKNLRNAIHHTRSYSNNPPSYESILRELNSQIKISIETLKKIHTEKIDNLLKDIEKFPKDPANNFDGKELSKWDAVQSIFAVAKSVNGAIKYGLKCNSVLKFYQKEQYWVAAEAEEAKELSKHVKLEFKKRSEYSQGWRVLNLSEILAIAKACSKEQFYSSSDASLCEQGISHVLSTVNLYGSSPPEDADSSFVRFQTQSASSSGLYSSLSYVNLSDSISFKSFNFDSIDDYELLTEEQMSEYLKVIADIVSLRKELKKLDEDEARKMFEEAPKPEKAKPRTPAKEGSMKDELIDVIFNFISKLDPSKRQEIFKEHGIKDYTLKSCHKLFTKWSLKNHPDKILGQRDVTQEDKDRYAEAQKALGALETKWKEYGSEKELIEKDLTIENDFAKDFPFQRTAGSKPEEFKDPFSMD